MDSNQDLHPKWTESFERQRAAIIAKQEKIARGELKAEDRYVLFDPKKRMDIDHLFANRPPGQDEEFFKIIQENDFFSDMTDEEFWAELERIS